MAVGIGNVHDAFRNAESTRLVERTIAQPTAIPTQKRFGSSLNWIDDFDFAVIRVGDVKLAVMIGDTQRVLQADFIADAVHISELKQSFANNRAHFSFAAERHGANGAD